MPGVLHTPVAAIAVFEREPYWTPELTRQFGDGSVAVRGCSKLADAEAALRDWPRGLYVIEFETARATVINWLARHVNRESHPVVMFASPAVTELEWTLRESGAVSFRTGMISGREMATHCRRLLRVPS